jgi:hypothetical protein
MAIQLVYQPKDKSLDGLIIKVPADELFTLHLKTNFVPKIFKMRSRARLHFLKLQNNFTRDSLAQLLYNFVNDLFTSVHDFWPVLK